jgi:hypothetical protein
MQITLFSEDHPKGLTVDWPSAPGTGDYVEFQESGGNNLLVASDVRYFVNPDGSLHSVRVDLSYDETPVLGFMG